MKKKIIKIISAMAVAISVIGNVLILGGAFYESQKAQWVKQGVRQAADFIEKSLAQSGQVVVFQNKNEKQEQIILVPKK